VHRHQSLALGLEGDFIDAGEHRRITECAGRQPYERQLHRIAKPPVIDAFACVFQVVAAAAAFEKTTVVGCERGRLSRTRIDKHTVHVD